MRNIVSLSDIVLASILTIGLWLTLMSHKVTKWLFVKVYPKGKKVRSYLSCPYCFTLPLTILANYIVLKPSISSLGTFWLEFLGLILVTSTIAGIVLHYFLKNNWFSTHYEDADKDKAGIKL